TASAQVAPSSAAMISSVAEQVGSIGYVSMVYVDQTVKMLEIDGVLPSQISVAENIYPLRTTLFIVGAYEPLAETQPDIRAFIAWMQSPEGQALVAELYVPFSLAP